MSVCAIQNIHSIHLLPILLTHFRLLRALACTCVRVCVFTGVHVCVCVLQLAGAMFGQHTRPFAMCFKAIVHVADILNRRQEPACRQVQQRGARVCVAETHGDEMR